MKKYDLESNTRIWEGKWLTAVNCVMAVFSAYCILATLFSRAALEKRLTLFLGLVVLMGFGLLKGPSAPVIPTDTPSQTQPSGPDAPPPVVEPEPEPPEEEYIAPKLVSKGYTFFSKGALTSRASASL